MNFTFNGKYPENINYNGTPLNKLQYNGVTVWEKSEPEPTDYSKVPLTIEIVSPGTLTLQYSRIASKSYLKYSLNKANYVQISANKTLNVAAGDTISLMGKGAYHIARHTWPSGWDNGTTNYGLLDGTATYNIKGNIASVFFSDIDWTDANTVNNAFAGNAVYKGLFYKSNIIDASNLYLQDLKLTNSYHAIYNSLFMYSKLLVGNPGIPKMLSCTVTGNVAPFGNMYRQCSSVKSVTIYDELAKNAYDFETAFYDCASLVEIISYVKGPSKSNCMLNWVGNVAPTGTFYNLGGYPFATGTSGIPSGWTVKTQLD